MLIVVDISWCTRIKIPSFCIFICFSNYEYSTSKVGFSVVIIVVGLESRSKLSYGNLFNSLTFVPTSSFFFSTSFSILGFPLWWLITVLYIIFFLATVEIFFNWLYTRFLFFQLFLLCYHCQVYCLVCHASCKVCSFYRYNNLLYLFEVFVTWV